MNARLSLFAAALAALPLALPSARAHAAVPAANANAPVANANAPAAPASPAVVTPVVPSELTPPPAEAVTAPKKAAEPNVLARAINLPAQQKMPESFGAPRQLVVAGGSGFSVFGTHSQLHGLKSDSFGLQLAPLVGVFAARNFLVGGTLPITYSRGSNLWYASVGVGPTFAWHVPVANHFGLLPRLDVTYNFSRAETYGVPNGSRSDSHEVYVHPRLDAIVHLAHHLSVTMGPYVNQRVYAHTNGAKGAYHTTYGGHVGLLGWF